jgi:hypothetical protein
MGFARRRPDAAAEIERRKLLIQRIGKSAAAAVIAGALFMFVAAAPQARADDRSHCQHAVEKAEANLDRAVRDHGEHSPQADARRHDLNAERHHCYEQYHQWWNGKEHRWETEENYDYH